MLSSTEIRWAAFLSLFIASTGCDAEVVGGSGSGGSGPGGAGGSGDSEIVTTGGSFPSTGMGANSFSTTECSDRRELWEKVLAGEDPSGTGGAGQGGSAEGGAGQGGSLTTSGQGGGQGGAGGGIPAGCPSVSDAARFLETGGDVTGGPEVGSDDTCCYEVYYAMSTGRPIFVEGRATTADVARGSGWGAPSIDRGAAGLSAEARQQLHAYWLTVARFEHASIASFAKFSLELLLLGAPADLLREAQRAGLDEVDHATATFAIAASYGEVSSKPMPMPELALARPQADVVAIVRGAIAEGCVAETVGAFEAGEQAELAESPDLRATLSTIASDEARHAALAWRFVRWALEAGQVDAATVRSAFRDAIAGQRASLSVASASAPGEGLLERHGRLSTVRRARLHAEVLVRVENLAQEIFGASVALS